MLYHFMYNGTDDSAYCISIKIHFCNWPASNMSCKMCLISTMVGFLIFGILALEGWYDHQYTYEMMDDSYQPWYTSKQVKHWAPAKWYSLLNEKYCTVSHWSEIFAVRFMKWFVQFKNDFFSSNCTVWKWFSIWMCDLKPINACLFFKSSYERLAKHTCWLCLAKCSLSLLHEQVYQGTHGHPIKLAFTPYLGS